VTAWALARGLLPDQIPVAQQTLASRDWLTAIEGAAGTAKTTLVGAIREFAEAQGYVVRGFGMTSRSVEELRGAGLNAETVASLLASQLPEPAAKELWIVDESSLLATKSVNGLMKKASAGLFSSAIKSSIRRLRRERS
jgi:ATP-dependent exoDNAse (exonuclease V) alpha subunit